MEDLCVLELVFPEENLLKGFQFVPRGRDEDPLMSRFPFSHLYLSS